MQMRIPLNLRLTSSLKWFQAPYMREMTVVECFRMLADGVSYHKPQVLKKLEKIDAIGVCEALCALVHFLRLRSTHALCLKKPNHRGEGLTSDERMMWEMVVHCQKPLKEMSGYHLALINLLMEEDDVYNAYAICHDLAQALHKAGLDLARAYQLDTSTSMPFHYTGHPEEAMVN